MGRFDAKISAYKSTSKYDIYFTRYFNYFYELATNRYIWDNLPEEIVPFRLEQYLTDQGIGLFFKDDVTNMFAVTKATLSGDMDIYDIPNERNSYANQYFETYDKDNSILLRDNTTGYPVVDYLMMFADSCANIRLTRDINVFGQRTPIVFVGDNSQKLTVTNLFKQYNDFVPFIPLNANALSLDQIKCMQTGIPFVADKLHILLKQEICQLLTFLGIDTVDDSKRERLVSDETKALNGESRSNRSIGLRLRQRSCDQINKMFGLNVNVRFNEEVGDIGAIYNKAGDLFK